MPLPSGYDAAGGIVDDEESPRFAERFGFVEMERVVEQVRPIGDEPAPGRSRRSTGSSRWPSARSCGRRRIVPGCDCRPSGHEPPGCRRTSRRRLGRRSGATNRPRSPWQTPVTTCSGWRMAAAQLRSAWTGGGRVHRRTPGMARASRSPRRSSARAGVGGRAWAHRVYTWNQGGLPVRAAGSTRTSGSYGNVGARCGRRFRFERSRPLRLVALRQRSTRSRSWPSSLLSSSRSSPVCRLPRRTGPIAVRVRRLTG